MYSLAFSLDCVVVYACDGGDLLSVLRLRCAVISSSPKPITFCDSLRIYFIILCKDENH